MKFTKLHFQLTSLPRSVVRRDGDLSLPDITEVLQLVYKAPMIHAACDEVDGERVNSDKLHDTDQKKRHQLVHAAVASR